MAILIKGMEMPDSCFLCRFCRRQEYGEYVGEDTAWSCVASKKRITDGQNLIATFKHPDCPLVEAAEVQNAVSRQAAIDALGERPVVWTTDDEYLLGARNQYDMDKLAIETVPSAQPEIEERMSEMEQNVPNDDFISRKRAIDVIRFECGEWTGLAKNIENKINVEPSAQPDLGKY